MRIAFIVQGEGRGHITQAISLFQQLQGSKHTVVACLVGMIKKDNFSSTIEHEIDAKVHYFSSPNLIYNQAGKGLSLKATLIQNLKKLPEHNKSLHKLKGWMDKYQPDLIINFYDFLAGVYQLRFPNSAPPMICVGHQYLLLHKEFVFPKKKVVDRILVNLNSRFTALRAKKMLALSLSPYENHKNIVSIPPLIRQSALSEPTSQHKYYVAYMTNPALLSQLSDWHLNHTDVEIHCFIKCDQEQEVTQSHKNLFIHKLDAKKFLRLMANAKGLITTAGFEAVCEAIYYGKPVMMVPVPNHFEQACNALDASRFGAGISQESFNLDKFLTYTSEFESPMVPFKNWLAEGKSKLIAELDSFEQILSLKQA
ncbi:glycosyltransferase family protein [Arcticibacterium luteifluviistationis]|uniref:Glycosyl transferase n=1 Tax=Arcticibacterium luteifluviistationis TaxID=1784714 RepID=A0A2Z4G8T5_9BACT|nr:glycosyltransferase family protein [Arcticibacterium luteifluviistationis]AWV97627.1 glycosyl transferase [Arcticibacterium luteifluviistationis]